MSRLPERALSNVLSPSVVKDTAVHVQNPHSALQHSCPGLGEIAKAGQRKVLESSPCFMLVFLSKALWPGVLPKRGLVLSCGTEEVTSLIAGGILVPVTGSLQNSHPLNVGRTVTMTKGQSHE